MFEMKEYNLKDALEIKESVEAVIIDLKEDDLSAVKKFPKLSQVYIKNYKLTTLPKEITELENLVKLNISAIEDTEKPFEVPENILELKNLKSLGLWNNFNYKNFMDLPNLLEFETNFFIRANQLEIIHEKAPNLKSLSLVGLKTKSKKINPVVGEFKNLEILSISWYRGINALPDEISKLKNLKELSIINNGLKEFPQVLTKLEGLRFLEMREHINFFPEDLTALKNLEEMRIHSCFNASVMDEKHYKELPESLGHLRGLKHLTITNSGMKTLNSINKLELLESLNLYMNDMQSLENIENFKNLKKLNLSSSRHLKSINELKGLAIEELNLDSCNGISDLQVLEDLKSLNTLNIEYVNNVKDYSPVYKHENLKNLKASGQILKAWKQKDLLRNLPSKEEILVKLSSKDYNIVSEGLLELSTYFKVNNTRDSGLIYDFFNINKYEMDEEDLNELPLLDELFSLHKDSLTSEELLILAKVTFQDITTDSYDVTIEVVKELIKRKDAKSQIKFIKIFKDSMCYYDAGHRYFSSNVQDSLIDIYLEDFDSKALQVLLDTDYHDLLNCEHGDCIDRLYIDAFKNLNPRNKKTRTQLISQFITYREEYLEYTDIKYFNDLIKEIREKSNDKVMEHFDAEYGKFAQEDEHLGRFEKVTTENVNLLLKTAVNDLSVDFISSNLEDFLDFLKENISSVDRAMMFELIDKIYTVSDSKWLNNELEKALFEDDFIGYSKYLKLALEKGNKETHDLIIVFNEVLDLSVENKLSYDDITKSKELYSENTGISLIELEGAHLNYLLTYISGEVIDDESKLSYILNSIVEILNKNKTKETKSLTKRGYSWTYTFVDYVNDSIRYKNDKYLRSLLNIFAALHTYDLKIKDQGLIYLPIIASIHLKDAESFDYIISLIEGNIDRAILAFNITCGMAIFKRKEELLKYTKLSIELGKTKKMFLDEADFKFYKEDPDFLKALDWKPKQ